MKEGFIKSYRPQNDDELYFSEPFTKWQAWHDLLFLAAYKDMFVFVRGVKVEVKRGQIAASDRFFAERWRWSRGKVERFLQLLTDMQRIEPQKSNVTTLISIINYSKYQDNRATNEATNEATNRANINEINKLINQEEKNINPPTPACAREENFDLETYGIMQNVKMKPSQYRHLVESYGEETAKEVIDTFSCKLADGSTDSANHFATIVSWLGYRRRMGAGSVPLSSTAASRYAKPAPADDPKRASREERIQWAKDLWEQVSEDERQDYINRYNCYPWERGDI